jgi:hypothetical protein
MKRPPLDSEAGDWNKNTRSSYRLCNAALRIALRMCRPTLETAISKSSAISVAL